MRKKSISIFQYLIKYVNFVKKTFSPVFSCASFYPLWAKIASEEEAASTVKLLPLLEREYGLAACQPIERKEKYQWDYPNCWASLQYLVVYGLDNYGYYEDAVRIATKYVRSIEKIYERFTGIVAEGRGMTVSEVDRIAQGRVWTGRDAVALNLADEIGTLEDAIDFYIEEISGQIIIEK